MGFGVGREYKNFNLNLISNRKMEHSLTDELNSMMQSVSRNIGLYDLTPEPLYSGRNSQVFHIVSQHDRRPQALKATAKRSHARKPEDIKAAYLKQRKIHETLKNRYIVQLENAFTDDSTFYLVLQYCAKGNLRSIMKNPLPIESIRNLGEQIARGLSYLHKSKIVHADLKPENILLTADGQIKICDFGESMRMQDKNAGSLKGDITYAPPQAFETTNQQRDVWAFGVILHEMATGLPPFSIKSWKELAIILNHNYLKNFPYSNTIQPALLHLLRQIFMHDHTKRLKIQQILLHPFFTNEPLGPSIVLTEKSQEHKQTKKPKTSRSKPNFKSLQLKEGNKQNKQNKNMLNLPTQANQPDYKKLLEKKFKEDNLKINKVQEISKASSKQNSGKKRSNKVYDDINSQTSKTHLTYNVRKNIFEARKGIVSPLRTQGMVIKEIDKKKSKIMIDKNGFTRAGETDWMNISCDGKIIKFRKNGTEKIFSLDSLPQKHLEKYQQAKKIVKEAMSCTPKIYYKDQELQLTIMYTNQLQVRFSDGVDFKGLEIDKILKNTINLDLQRATMLQNVALALLSLKRK